MKTWTSIHILFFKNLYYFAYTNAQYMITQYSRAEETG